MISKSKCVEVAHGKHQDALAAVCILDLDLTVLRRRRNASRVIREAYRVL